MDLVPYVAVLDNSETKEIQDSILIIGRIQKTGTCALDKLNSLQKHLFFPIRLRFKIRSYTQMQDRKR
ncbi:hypothetical protein ATE84_0607 [Aquimarina sp. MAR_2010_214]|uniref:hypothetical protein n=1 Tax=Aquimarina sp. MAR_2010_214 TaxID=1250026 RepID=UPI000CC62F12|nr:hypothetical protein [Aquimarina sp. MAR_2010_214]PKV48605.1 hypothetical protein ATE84_0607 [Aquimarina sp. MAR_2010_214]